MRFTDPLYLLLFLPLAIGLWLSFRHVHGMAKGRKRLAFGVRFLLAGFVILALAGPQARRPNHGICTIFVLDRSDSVSEKERKRAEEFVATAMASLGPDDVGGVIAFGKDAVVDAMPDGRRTVGRILSQVDPSASDLASAIRLATASFPEGKGRRIVVLSDGNETTGDAEESAEVASTESIDIDHVALGVDDRGAEASVVELQQPEEVRLEQPFNIRVIVDSTVPQEAVIALDRDGVLVKETPVKLAPGRSSIVLSETLHDTGFHRYRATLRAPRDRDNRNNIGVGFVAVRGKPRALVLQESTGTSPLADALKKGGTDVVLAGPGGLPAKPEDLQPYDAVFFNDFNAKEVTAEQMKLVQAGIRDSGIGFAMVGGENSFLPGGYYATPIADTLPVDLNIRQRKSFPSTSILIMVDASGSMGMVEDGMPKIRLAAKGAEATVNMMSPMDRVGVAGSTDGIEFVAPMQQLTDKASVIRQIQKLSIGGGGIYIEPSMEKGAQVLRAETTKVRHFILMADGDDCDTHEGSIAIALALRSEHITTSVVAIGEGKDVEFCKQLAAAGGGRFYLAKHAGQLPAIVTQDTAVMSRSAIEEGAFLPKLAEGEPILRGIDSAPAMYAYCLVDSRPLASVGMRTGKDDPLLATWQYGLGTTLAFTSDAQARWAARWVPWEGFSTFWTQALRVISRRAAVNEYQVGVHMEGGKGQIQVEATDRLGRPLTQPSIQVHMSGPDGTAHELTLPQEAPGKFRGSFGADQLGSYIVTVSETDPSGVKRVKATGFSIPYPPEYRSFLPNRPLLKLISDLTGGRALAAPTESLRPILRPGESITELWQLFMMLAALVIPFDVGVRRLALPMREMFAKLWARLRRKRQDSAETHVRIDRLRQAKERASSASREAPDSAAQGPAPMAGDRPAVKPASSTKPGTAVGSKLLESKRQRDRDRQE